MGRWILAAILAGVLPTAAHAARCTAVVRLSQDTFAAQGGAATATVTAPADCAWDLRASARWVLLREVRGQGPKVVDVYVQATESEVTRTARVSVKGGRLRNGARAVEPVSSARAGASTARVTQRGQAECATDCLTGVTPEEFEAPVNGTSRECFHVETTSNRCCWKIEADDDWVHPLGSTGVGSTDVCLKVDPNVTDDFRESELIISEDNGLELDNDQSISVSQDTRCIPLISPNPVEFAGAGEVRAVRINFPAGCTTAWEASTSAADEAAGWAVIQGASSGSGSGQVVLGAGRNPTTTDRTGFFDLDVAAERTALIQHAPPPPTLPSCTVALGAFPTIPFAGGQTCAIVDVSSDRCDWSVVGVPDFVRVTTPLSGRGDGTICVEAARNGVAFELRGPLTVSVTDGATAVAQVVQGVRPPCSLQVDPLPELDASGGTVCTMVHATDTSCPWTVSLGDSWISLSISGGTGSGQVCFAALPNTAPAPRSMSVTIANVPLTLTQRGRPGSCTVTTGAFTLVGHGGGAVCAPVTFPERQDCFWEVLDVPAWATLSAGARVGDGEVCVTLAANTSWEARTASIRVNVPSWGPTFMLLTQERDPSWTIVEPRSSGNDYLWKPRSDSDGKLVVALPPAFKNSIDKVELHRTIPMGAGTYIERGGFAGLANGDRSYFRFDHAGSSYSDGLYVVVFRSAGRKVAYHIPNTSGTYYYN